MAANVVLRGSASKAQLDMMHYISGGAPCGEFVKAAGCSEAAEESSVTTPPLDMMQSGCAGAVSVPLRGLLLGGS